MRGTTRGGSTTLSVDVRVTPNAAGNVTLTTDTPQVKGASNASFSFSLTLTNDTPEDLPFSVTATGPAGWTVTAQVGTTAQAASVVVKAGATTTVSVTAKATDGTAAGTYPIAVDATSGSQTAHADLSVEITGSYSLTLTTSDQRLNMSATAGTASDLTLTVTNTGTADIAGVAMTASAPTGLDGQVRSDPGRRARQPGGPGRGPRHAVGRRHRGRLRGLVQGHRARSQRLGRRSGDDRDLPALGRRRHRPDRHRARRPVADVPPVRPSMSGIEAPPLDATPAAPAPATDARHEGPEPVIRTRKLTKKYGTLTAVDRLDLEVYPGEVFGLLGQNGAGKTTTILMLLGLSEPTDGEATVMGLDPAWEPREVKRRVGYLPDAVGFYEGMTGRENLRYTARLNGLDRREAAAAIDEVLEQVGLTSRADDPVGAYSRGMRQRLGIADALVKSPDLLILDEPTTSIDPIGVVEILDLLRRLVDERGLAIMLSSHLLSQVQTVCDRIGIFANGRLIGVGHGGGAGGHLRRRERRDRGRAGAARRPPMSSALNGRSVASGRSMPSTRRRRAAACGASTSGHPTRKAASARTSSSPPSSRASG